MTAPERPLLAEMKDEIGSLAAELREMAALRCKLAKTELQTDAVAIKRLAVALLLVAVMVFGALPILMVAVAGLLGRCTAISQTGWLLLLGFGLLAAGSVTGWLAWRRFRRRFVGLQETLEELHEDALWLGEWLGGGEEPEKTVGSRQ